LNKPKPRTIDIIPDVAMPSSVNGSDSYVPGNNNVIIAAIENTINTGARTATAEVQFAFLRILLWRKVLERMPIGIVESLATAAPRSPQDGIIAKAPNAVRAPLAIPIAVFNLIRPVPFI
jgi:hypothetical protein